MPQDPDDRPYNTYESRPRGVGARLRGESDQELGLRAGQAGRGSRNGSGAGPGSRDGRGTRGRGASRPAPRPGRFGILSRGIAGTRVSPLRILRWLIMACVVWVIFSAVLFFFSASQSAGDLPGGRSTVAALSGSGPILTSANNILVIGLDNRPRTGYSSKEGGSNYSEAAANTDTLMLWRLGGGVSRRLSVPRDTLVNIPHLGMAKINAAWSVDGPAGTVRVVEKLLDVGGYHVKINHVIVVDLGNFPKFINDIGGITVKTPRICSSISGGKADGGYTLNLKPGYHHLSGDNALTLARTRDNSCNLAYNDLNREAMQQEILNAIKSQLFSAHAFFHLPWAAWDAPKTIQTDMGPLSLLQMFIASEIGGSAPTNLLSESNSTYNGEDVLIPNHANIVKQVRKLLTGQ